MTQQIKEASALRCPVTTLSTLTIFFSLSHSHSHSYVLIECCISNLSLSLFMVSRAMCIAIAFVVIDQSCTHHGGSSEVDQQMVDGQFMIFQSVKAHFLAIPLALLCDVAKMIMSAICTCSGRVSAYITLSAMSSPLRGVMPLYTAAAFASSP